jgi:hypothetical protein
VLSMILLLVAAILVVVYANHLVDVHDVNVFRRRRPAQFDPWKELLDSRATDETPKKD